MDLKTKIADMKQKLVELADHVGEHMPQIAVDLQLKVGAAIRELEDKVLPKK